MIQTLKRRGSSLASSREQILILEGSESIPSFASKIAAASLEPLRSRSIEVLQINVGKVCNQTCGHCHVDAGPDRRESMTWETMEACLAAVEAARIPIVDITGGAPELNPSFRRLVDAARALGARVIDRCNLTILLAPGYQDLIEFLANRRVEIVASLPCYLAENVDRQRGAGVHEKSIEVIRRLNAVGYGVEGSGLELALVYNPGGASLPPPQDELEKAYRLELFKQYNITFNRLYTITNMPISRFLEDLLARGDYERYMEKLVSAFNPRSIGGLMCRSTLSVGWDGRLYDCDFNQMLELEVAPGYPRTIGDFDALALDDRPIVTGRHCFGCAAGSGSSCQGAIV